MENNNDLLENYNDIKKCFYKGEYYSVRDNGAILRHSKKGSKHSRKNDNTWTFGVASPQNGYMIFCKERVHRIVATAFHGVAPTNDHVVDHIDTNRQNNRPENLRWLSKLENILNNEITRSKIEHICGSIENFLKNPSLLRNHSQEDKNFEWMRTVSYEEATKSLANIKQWLKRPTPQNGNTENHGKMGDWIFGTSIPNSPAKARAALASTDSSFDQERRIWYNNSSVTPQTENADNISFIAPPDAMEDSVPKAIQSLTENCKQINWKVPVEFICCPKSYGNFPIEDYARNLAPGIVYTKNERYESVVEDFIIDDDKSKLWVMVHLGLWTYGIAEITFEDGIFYHNYLTHFESLNACQQWITTELQGKKWDGYDWMENE